MQVMHNRLQQRRAFIAIPARIRDNWRSLVKKLANGEIFTKIDYRYMYVTLCMLFICGKFPNILVVQTGVYLVRVTNMHPDFNNLTIHHLSSSFHCTFLIQTFPN